MQGQYLDIGGRRTYFPPYANERFGNPPYWSCTFTSLLNGLNVGWLGRWPATPGEIRALAKASGDVDTRGGSRSSHMIAAMRVRHGKKMAIESLRPELVKRRLSSGWAMVAGVTYGALPEAYRRPSPRFKGGHRVVLIGWDGDRTRLLDPMQKRDSTFAGQWIRWSDFEPAWWSAEQLWFQEGMFLARPAVRVISTFHPARSWLVKAGRLVAGRSPDDPRKVVKVIRPSHDSSAPFDSLVEVMPGASGAEPMGRFIHVTKGALAGLLIDPRTPGVTADTSPGGAGVILTAGSTAKVDDPLGAARLDAARKEFERVSTAFNATGKLPAPPA